MLRLPLKRLYGPSFWYISQNLARIDIAREFKLVRLLPLFIYDSIKPRQELTGV